VLILSRKVDEKILIGDGIEVVVTRISGHQIQIGVKADKSVNIRRGELEPVEREGERDG
jgi:carbon storage regulator